MRSIVRTEENYFSKLQRAWLKKKVSKRKTWVYSVIFGANYSVILRSDHWYKQTTHLR